MSLKSVKIYISVQNLEAVQSIIAELSAIQNAHILVRMYVISLLVDLGGPPKMAAET